MTWKRKETIEKKKKRRRRRNDKANEIYATHI